MIKHLKILFKGLKYLVPILLLIAIVAAVFIGIINLLGGLGGLIFYIILVTLGIAYYIGDEYG